MPPTLAPAFAASLTVHAVLAFALVSWVAVGDRAQFPGRESLAVLLVGAAAPQSADAPSADLAIVAPAPETPRVAEPAAQAEVRIAVPPSAARDARAEAALPAAAPSANRVVSLGSVDVRLLTEAMYTGLHPVHADRAEHEFPIEIAQGVRLAAKPDVKYPEDALAARRQGFVLAFVIVDATGAVEEVSIVEGAPEFAQPVQDALLATRFRPAEDRGTPVRFYTMLRFDFVPNTPGAVPAEAAPAKTRRRLTWYLPPAAGLQEVVSRRTNPALPSSPRKRGPSVVVASGAVRLKAAGSPLSRGRHWVIAAAGRFGPYPIIGMWNPGAALPSSGQRVVSVLPRV